MASAQPRGFKALPQALGAGALALLLSSCAGAPEPGENKPQLDDCLRNVDLSQLPEQIRRCDAVVEAFPGHPQPRNERALLLRLAGKPQEACKDSLQAAEDLRDGQHRVEALMADEIALRRRICQRLTSDPTAPEPSSATPDGAAAGSRD
jgi:hypothetical protein